MNIGKDELVQRSRRGLGRAIFSRTGLILLLFLVQAGLLVSVMVWFQEWQAHVVGGSVVLTMGAVLVVLMSLMRGSRDYNGGGMHVIFAALGATSSNATSPTSLKPVFAVSQGTRLMPTSTTTTPSLTISPSETVRLTYCEASRSRHLLRTARMR